MGTEINKKRITSRTAPTVLVSRPPQVRAEQRADPVDAEHLGCTTLFHQ